MLGMAYSAACARVIMRIRGRWAVESNSERIRLEVFMKRGKILSQDSNVDGSSFQMSGAATEKAHLRGFSSGNVNLHVVDELSGDVREVCTATSQVRLTAVGKLIVVFI